VVAGRVALLATAAAAIVVAFAAARRDDRRVRAAHRAVTYACAMHPQVTSASPGECPICRMTLERVHTAAEPADPRAGAAPFRPSYDVMWARPRPALREMRAPAWVDADGVVIALYYNDEIATLVDGERGTFSAADAPASPSPVRVTRSSPARWDEATSAVRLTFETDGAPPAGTVGWVKLATRSPRTLVVPDSALLRSHAGPYVLTMAPDRRSVTKQSVEIGRARYGFASIVSGLRDGERIAVMDAFFLDAERRLGARPDGDRPPRGSGAP
jgi:hypothetical protein